jgi:glycosyltransferase involved in cell wall biosynthesis
MRIKMRLLRLSQGRSFRRAQGLIFLTHYAENEISMVLGGITCPTALVPHGIEARFLLAPRPQRPLAEFTAEHPFRVLYVSILMPYKHQLEVAKAAAELRSQGLPIEIRFVGATWGSYGREFKRVIKSLDPHGAFLKWSGHEPFEALHRFYGEADATVETIASTLSALYATSPLLLTKLIEFQCADFTDKTNLTQLKQDLAAKEFYIPSLCSNQLLP